MAIAYRTQVNGPTRGGFAALVVAAHVIAIYAIAVSLDVVKAPPIIKDMDLVYIETPKPAEPPKAQPPKIKREVELPVPTPLEVPAIENEPVLSSEPVLDAITSPPIESTSLSVTRRTDPVYPPASRRAGEAGQVQLRVLVDESGHPREVQVLKSSGYERLDEAAVTAIKRWLFAPARQGSGPVTSWTQVSVLFRLEQ